MRSKTTIVTTSLLLSLATGCSLIKVNGKPLGGGTSSPASSPDAGTEAASSESPPPAKKYESTKELEERQRREFQERERKEEIARGKTPAWCKDNHIPDTGDVDLKEFDKVMESDNLYRTALRFGEVMCSVRGRNLEQRPKVMEIRTAWMKKHALDEQDFAAAVSVETRYVPDDQSLKSLGPAVAQLERSDPDTLDKLGARASMLGRIAYVERCVAGDEKAIKRIQCAREPLDLAKALAEIDAAPGILPHMRLRLRLRVRKVIARHAKLNAELAELAKSEPAVTKLIAIADAQHKEWANTTPARAKAVKLLEEMEAATEANKNSAFAGCEATTGAAWTEVVRAATFPALGTEYTLQAVSNAIFTTPEAFLVRRAYELCMAGTDHKDATPYRIVGVRGARRGPRSATNSAWMAAAGDITFDSKDLSMAAVVHGSSNDLPDEKYGAVGTIAKVSPVGTDAVELSFKADVDKREDCIDWKRTGRISNVTAGGAVEYENVCTKRGMVKYDKSPDDMRVNATFAAGLKPGMFLIMGRNSMRLASGPVAATASAKAGKPVWVLGVSLK
jgi:hypothetical protein